MKGHCSLMLFFIWFSCIISMQVLLFMNGFLLTRVSQFQNSTCSVHIDCNDHETCDSTQFSLNQHSGAASQTCFKQNTKAILLLVDAFRYDFAVYNESLKEPDMYQNKIKVIHTLMHEQPNNSRLFTFVADPPTTTMQRLKGLTTGSLPTFIDAGSNFATHEINEDNVLDQLLHHHYNATFMGDDTWTGLYPKRFMRNYPYPSFNVWDLDTVDNGVLEHLYDEMKTSDWKLLVAHFLGVDHCGHRYGPNHPEMSRKLLQMNDVIENVIHQLDDDTVLFVLGDHGMTSTGDHGGESKNEINAALFAYSKKPLSDAYVQRNNTVKQVDLVPTLSVLLGIPIPHSNLGSLIHDCLPADVHSWKHIAFASWANAQQLIKYITEYAASSDLFTADKLDEIMEDSMVLRKMINEVKNKEDAVEFINAVDLFIRNTRAMCEEIWIQFDAFSMARGLLLLSCVTIFAYLLVDGDIDVTAIINKKFVILCYASTAVAILVSCVIYLLNYVPSLLNTIYFLSGLGALVILAYITVEEFTQISQSLHSATKSRTWVDVLNRVILAFTALMLLSNSFILEESKVTLFFLLTVILLQLVQFLLSKLQNKVTSIKTFAKSKIFVVALIMCIFIRVSMNYWRCREEQGCNNSIFLSSKTTGGKVEWFVAAFCTVVFTILMRIWLITCGNLNGQSANVLIARYATIVTALSISGFWILHGLPTETKHKMIGPIQADTLAWTAYVGIGCGVLSVIFKPLFVYHLNDKTKIELTDDNVIPSLVKYVFEGKEKKPPVVFGLATVYSAAFLLIVINFSFIWLLVLDYVLVPSCIALLVTVALSLLVITLLKFEKALTNTDLLSYQSSDVMMWFLFSIYIFYATGHQPAFPNISWEAAFVGTIDKDGQLINNVIPASLVIINTFGSYILMGFTIPLILIAPFTFYAIAPPLINKKRKFNLHRGEMELYDSKQHVLETLFKLTIKYIMCHILRMFAIMLSATIHCRHLMVWNVFAPKLIFEGIALFVTLASAIFGFILFIHISQKLDNFVVKLCKQNS